MSASWGREITFGAGPMGLTFKPELNLGVVSERSAVYTIHSAVVLESAVTTAARDKLAATPAVAVSAILPNDHGTLWTIEHLCQPAMKLTDVCVSLLHG